MAQEKAQKQTQPAQPAPAQPAQNPPQQGGGTGKGVLLGCGIGCAVIVLVIVVLVVFAWCGVAKWGTGWKDFETPTTPGENSAMDEAANEAMRNAP